MKKNTMYANEHAGFPCPPRPTLTTAPLPTGRLRKGDPHRGLPAQQPRADAGDARGQERDGDRGPSEQHNNGHGEPPVPRGCSPGELYVMPGPAPPPFTPSPEHTPTLPIPSSPISLSRRLTHAFSLPQTRSSTSSSTRKTSSATRPTGWRATRRCTRRCGGSTASPRPSASSATPWST
jgi:hypothetical protein